MWLLFRWKCALPEVHTSGRCVPLWGSAALGSVPLGVIVLSSETAGREVCVWRHAATWGRPPGVCVLLARACLPARDSLSNVSLTSLYKKKRKIVRDMFVCLTDAEVPCSRKGSMKISSRLSRFRGPAVIVSFRSAPG
ncbi:uncharacterized protein TEOVI_000791500 [Trypanosoma equiperdum]|uniref:Uncharacterized protein n=2 Tax=Trypanozoon TaxID=39700 RepID=Q38F59_TRYB2|nr:hypothetical protein, unlikely [Trypanosoma brucei brucei TREU927]EAN76561.1 hypothetical protein, unlikely [Trypanosoma brucei brucei TREU927]SCU68329.1 hypothetical protein, conserved [Trypanosoma equiperdum]